MTNSNPTSPKPVEPTNGQKITLKNGKLSIPDRPIVPFIEGDGTGRDIWRASVRVLDAAVQKAYGGKRKIEWMEVYAGEKAFNAFKSWLPDETVAACREYLVSIKGPLTTPVGGGGLIGGTALAVRGTLARCRVIAAEPAQAAVVPEEEQMPSEREGYNGEGLPHTPVLDQTGDPHRAISSARVPGRWLVATRPARPHRRPQSQYLPAG